MITDIIKFSQMFYESTFLPVACYNMKTAQSVTFPLEHEVNKVINETLPGFMHFTKNPDYFIADSFSYFGFVKSSLSDYCLIIGPVFSTPTSETSIHAFMKEWAVNSEHRSTISQFIKNIPQLSFYQFLNTLAYLHFAMNDESIVVSKHFNLEDISHIHAISTVHSEKLVETKETQRHHNTYYFENELMQYIQNGDVEKLRTCLSNAVPLTEGIVADNALRQEKNIFISIVTLTSRSAILGGMNIEEAYQLSDVYIQECERSQDLTYISNLSYSMLIDFAERVSVHKIPGGMSKEVFECVQFISRNINDSIQVSDVAEHIQRSRSYLTQKFKQELGFDISSFIMRCKLEEAKSLLTFSEKSLSEISNYLCFSSQAYFQNVFKKKYGITPMQYRNDTRQIR